MPHVMDVPTIESVMTRAPRVVQGSEDSMTARAMMEQHGVRHLPVVHEGALFGILSERDVRGARALLDSTRGELGPPVLALCSRDPLVVLETDPIDEVAIQMANRRVGTALVVEGERLVGIVTTVDLCRELARIVGRLRASSRAFH
ncbi:MAG: CBS domain-containing protein [Myxococcota bacterium]